MKEYILYKITSPSGLVYIGQTSNLKLRLRSYKYCKCTSQRILFNSIKKYSWDAHEFVILNKLITTPEHIDNLEIEQIAYYKNLKISLNIAAGGRNGNKGNIRSKGADNPNSIKVYQFDLDSNFIKSFDCISDASKSCNVSISKISKAITNKSYYSGGYLWLNKELFDKKIVPLRKNNVFKKCVQLTKNNEYINTFYCASLAGKKVGISSSHILKCLRGQRMSAGGYKWMKEDEYNQKFL
jgi:hypothetical protein